MKVICVGRNYADHISELNNTKPLDPVLFLKPDSAIILKNRPFYIPDFSNDINYEIELIIKISRLGKHIQKKFSHRIIFFDLVGCLSSVNIYKRNLVIGITITLG